jgi:hypothetical protein
MERNRLKGASGDAINVSQGGRPYLPNRIDLTTIDNQRDPGRIAHSLNTRQRAVPGFQTRTKSLWLSGRLQHQSPSAPRSASSRALREAPPAKADILSIFLHSGASMTIMQSLTYGGSAWRS